MNDPSTWEITPQEVAEQLSSGQRIFLLDVREPEEYALAKLPEGELLPMGSVPGALSRLEGIAEEMPIVVYCHHGVRSLHVVAWLRTHGVEDCRSMAGGIDRYSREIDSIIPRY